MALTRINRQRFSIGLLALVINLLSCSSSNNDVDEAFTFDPSADQYKPEAINVGSIVYTPSVRNAILLAAKQINQSGGVLGKEYNVIGFIGDSTESAVRLAENILNTDIKAINVSYSSRSKAVSELSIAKQIPLISESATSPFFSSYADDDFYFRLVPSDIIQSRILAEIAIEQGVNRVVTVHNDTDQYGETLIEHFKINFELLSGQVLSQIAVPFSVSRGFDEYLQVIATANPDMILNAILEADVAANFTNEAVVFGLNSPFLLPDSSAGVSSFVNNIVDLETVSDALGTAPGYGLATNSEMIYFSQSYFQQFAVTPDVFDVSGYDFAMVTALAIEHAGYVNNTDNPSGLMVRDSLRAVMNPPGEIVSPSNISRALQLIKSGIDVDYSGSYGANDWDENGDISGEITYDVLNIDVAEKKWKTLFQQQIYLPLAKEVKK